NHDFRLCGLKGMIPAFRHMGRDHSTARDQTGRGRQLYGPDLSMAPTYDQGMAEVALMGEFGLEPVPWENLCIPDQFIIRLLPYRHFRIHSDIQDNPTYGIRSHFRAKRR